MKKLSILLFVITSSTLFAKEEVVIDIKSLSWMSTCRQVEKLEEEVREFNIKLLWSRCISARKRSVSTGDRYNVYYDNPYYQQSDVAHYTIREDERNTGWTKRLIGAKVSEYGVYELYKNNDSGKELIYESKTVGKVKIVGRVGSTYVRIGGAGYKYRGLRFRRSRIVKSLISIALDNFHADYRKDIGGYDDGYNDGYDDGHNNTKE